MVSRRPAGEKIVSAPSEDFNRVFYIDLLKRGIINHFDLGGDTPFERFRRLGFKVQRQIRAGGPRSD